MKKSRSFRKRHRTKPNKDGEEVKKRSEDFGDQSKRKTLNAEEHRMKRTTSLLFHLILDDWDRNLVAQ